MPRRLTEFFRKIHHAIPLFEEARFIQSYDSGEARRDLIVAIVAITAKLLGPIYYWTPENLSLCANSLLVSSLSGVDSDNPQGRLVDFQLECLLSYYEFHQFPGPKSCLRIARLSRRAYSVGLHQIENPRLCSAFDAASATAEAIEDWRYVWWSVYCLDSYSSISSGTPYATDEQSLNTALPTRSFDNGFKASCESSSPKMFLPYETSELWRVAQAIVSHGELVSYRIYIVVTMMIRQAGSILRLRTERGLGCFPERTMSVKTSLASLRLALPPRYLDPTRNVLNAETAPEHHIRLTNVLVLHMARIMVSLPARLSSGEDGWITSWEETINTAECIVQVVEQWDTRFSLHADPAICFIVFLALFLLNLHRRYNNQRRALAVVSQNETILLLFLKQFGKFWSLPRVLGGTTPQTPIHPISHSY